MKNPVQQERTPRVEITPEQRYHMVNDVAYFRALKQRQETGSVEDQAVSWCQVEGEIDTMLKQRHVK